MASDNIETVRDAYTAFARRDAEAVLELLDPEFEVHQTTLLPWGGEYRGHSGAQQFFGTLLQHVDSTVQPQHFIDAGERVAVVGRVVGTARATGKTFDLAICHLWTVREGKALRFEAYIDTPGILRALAG